jgi:MFS family permease
MKAEGVPYRRLFRDRKFGVFFCSAAIGLFPLFVAPFFLPMYGTSMGLSPSSSAGLVAGFNLASAVGRISFGQVSDQIGPINALIIALVWNAISLLVIWPVSTSLAPLVVFVISNGMANGGFFALMPTVVGSITESSKLASAMSMLITGWTGGYLMVCSLPKPLSCTKSLFRCYLQGAPIAGYLLEAFGGENSGLEPYRPA